MIDYDKTLDFIISQGDSIHLPIEPDFDSFVKIQGQIKNPGKYPFNNKMKINDLLNATMSTDNEDFYNTMDLSKINIFRKNPSSKSPLSMTLNVDKDFYLKNGDHITIPKKEVLEPIESVIITGEVKTPGIYPVNYLTNLNDILKLSGGYTDLSLKNGIEIFRDTIRIAWEKETFLLKDGDSLNVLKKSGLVLINGEVNVPGYVSFKSGDSIKKYIKRAGGFNSFAETRDVLIIYPNGTAIPYSRWFSPKVLEGSTITVNQRTISGSSKGPSGWEAFSIISTQAGNVATTLLTLIILMEQSRGSSGT